MKEVPLANWPWVDIKKQNFVFFSTRLLDSIGLDPNFDLENVHVTMEECSALFGGLKKFKRKSLELYSKVKNKLEDIYWRVFGIVTITNNEFHAWIVQGFIAQIKGNPINWAKVVE
jgi:hypothetical protein